jgi:hypothetical protein
LLKVLIVGHSGVAGGGCGRSIAYKNFLSSKGFTVETLHFPGDNFSSRLWYYYQHGLSLFLGQEKQKMNKIADRLQNYIKNGRYDAVICVETWCSYVLAKELNCLKIFSCESLMADEFYFSKSYDPKQILDLRKMELDILQKADYVVLPWKTTENYIRKHIWNGDNLLTIKYGCFPQKKIASYFYPCSIISLGNLEGYWNNPELISFLTTISPYVIDLFGKNKPPKKYRLNYKGFAPSLDILKYYQFGLCTLSKDTFRRNHFSSRILGYLAYGLPVLSPEWMQLTHELKGVVPYNEDNFLQVIDTYSDEDKWTKLSKEAYEQALELDWNKVLLPLEKILRKG